MPKKQKRRTRQLRGGSKSHAVRLLELEKRQEEERKQEEHRRAEETEAKRLRAVQNLRTTKNKIKFLQNSLVHHGFQYRAGLNVDTVPFDATGECRPGGLYFTTTQHARVWAHMGSLVADVELPADAQIYCEPCGTKFKADKIILSNIRVASNDFFYPRQTSWWQKLYKFLLSCLL